MGKAGRSFGLPLIFIGTPLYYGREPLIWKDYISKLPDMSGKPGSFFDLWGGRDKTS
jgi:hypothetical protein